MPFGALGTPRMSTRTLPRIDLSHQSAIVWVILGAVLVTVIAALASLSGLVTHGFVQVLPGLVFAAAAVVVAARVLGDDLTAGDSRRFLVWVAIGGLAFGAFGIWYPLTGGIAIGERSMVYGLFTTVTAGILFGTVVGAYDVLARQRERAEQAAVERQRETVTLLNGLLRHHLLNGINVVEGHAALLEGHVDEAGQEHLRIVHSRSEGMTETIQNLRRIARQITETPDPRALALAPTVEAAVHEVRDRHPHATVTVGPIPGDLQVLATDSLEIVLWNVLSNGIVHDPGPEPTVAVTVAEDAETVTIDIVDEGPGVPPGRRERIFEARERSEDSVGDGLGLYLSARVVEQYGGDIWVEDAETGGARFRIRLPRAPVNGQPPASSGDTGSGSRSASSVE